MDVRNPGGERSQKRRRVGRRDADALRGNQSGKKTKRRSPGAYSIKLTDSILSFGSVLYDQISTKMEIEICGQTLINYDFYTEK